MATARTIISLALQAMNKLSPGEVLDADLAAACLLQLNVIADNWSVGRDMAPQDVIATGAVTGPSITLGSGAFVAIPPGTEIISMQSDGFSMAPITMQQYNDIDLKTQTGRPEVWAVDGLATVFVYPAGSGNTVSILTRAPFTEFADLDTNYILPPGYKGAFAASLAVAMSPTLLGDVPPALLLAERKALFNVSGANVRPAMVNADPLSRRYNNGNILTGWN